MDSKWNNRYVKHKLIISTVLVCAAIIACMYIMSDFSLKKENEKGSGIYGTKTDREQDRVSDNVKMDADKEEINLKSLDSTDITNEITSYAEIIGECLFPYIREEDLPIIPDMVNQFLQDNSVSGIESVTVIENTIKVTDDVIYFLLDTGDARYPHIKARYSMNIENLSFDLDFCISADFIDDRYTAMQEEIGEKYGINEAEINEDILSGINDIINKFYLNLSGENYSTVMGLYDMERLKSVFGDKTDHMDVMSLMIKKKDYYTEQSFPYVEPKVQEVYELEGCFMARVLLIPYNTSNGRHKTKAHTTWCLVYFYDNEPVSMLDSNFLLGEGKADMLSGFD